MNVRETIAELRRQLAEEEMFARFVAFDLKGVIAEMEDATSQAQRAKAQAKSAPLDKLIKDTLQTVQARRRRVLSRHEMTREVARVLRLRREEKTADGQLLREYSENPETFRRTVRESLARQGLR